MFTQAGRVAAFLEFEKLIGRELDLVHVFNEWADPFPTPSDRELAAQRPVLMISWSGTDTRAIASGLEDDVIRQQAQGIKSLGKPILLRWRWEMDRPNLQASVWSPEDYIAAWKHIRKIFDAEQVTNVGWVWCPHARGYVEPGRNAAAYYPGDDSVDWLCADVYAEPDDSSFQEAAGPFLEWAAKHPKPIVIGEFGSRRGDRGAWLREAAEAIQRNPQIKAIAYFDGNSKAAAGGEYRLAPSPDAVEAFRELAKRPHFASAGG